MAEKIVRLREDRVGIRAGNTFFSPTDFGFAFIGTTNESRLVTLLSETEEKVLSGSLKRDDYPYLHEYMRDKERKGKSTSIDDLKQIAERNWGTAKIIERTAVVKKLGGHIGTISRSGILSMEVETREDARSAPKKKYMVTIENPFLASSSDIFNFAFADPEVSEGQSDLTLAEEKTRRRGSVLYPGLDHERIYKGKLLAEIQLRHKRYPDKYHITDTDANHDLTTFPRLAGYPVAVALTALEKVMRTYYYEYIHGSEAYAREPVAMPFAFHREPWDAFEILLEYGALAKHKKREERKKRIAQIDRDALKRDIVSSQFKDLQQEGKAFFSVRRSNRDLSDSTWAILYALIDHFYLNRNRRFMDFTLEFTEGPHERVSYVFDGKADVALVPGIRDLSARVVFDGNGLPILIYKNYSVRGVEGAPMIGDSSPRYFVNPPKTAEPEGYEAKKYFEEDWRTGRLALCTPRIPDMQILRKASIYTPLTGRRISAEELASRYEKAYSVRMRERKR